MAQASDYPITTPFGWVKGYPLNLDPNDPSRGYHNGIDYGCPSGTPVIVNGVTIGLSGATGYVTGAHLHVGRWVGGVSTNPGAGGGFSFDNARVTEVNQDATNGKYVRIQADGASWVYLHLSQPMVSVGQVLTKQPQGGNIPMTDENFVTAFFIDLFDVRPTPQQLAQYINRPWQEVYNELRSAQPHHQLVDYYKQLRIDDDARVKRIQELEQQLAAKAIDVVVNGVKYVPSK